MHGEKNKYKSLWMQCGTCAESSVAFTIYDIHAEGRLAPFRFGVESAAVHCTSRQNLKPHSPSYAMIRVQIDCIQSYPYSMHTLYYCKKEIKLISKGHLSHDGLLVEIMLFNCISGQAEIETGIIYRCGPILYSSSLFRDFFSFIHVAILPCFVSGEGAIKVEKRIHISAA